MNQKFSIIIPVRNGKDYINLCLEALISQTYKNFEIILFDNNSNDDTLKIVQNFQLKFKKLNIEFKIVKSKNNYFVGGAFNRAYEFATGQYLVLLCVDVILDKDFLKKSQEIFAKNKNIGAIQAKIFQYDIKKIINSKSEMLDSNIIDTCGFEVFRSRRIVNIGHGESDSEKYNKEFVVFGVEGACPVFRREALKSVKLNIDRKDEIFDEGMLWYGDDIDMAWRLNLAGWAQVFSPNLIAYHDRKTTKSLSHNTQEFIKIRKTIPSNKRILDYRNTRLALIKNEYWRYFKKDLFIFLKREILLLGYFFIFEPKTFCFGIFGFLKLFPKTFKRRKLFANKIDKKSIKRIYSELIKK